MSGQKTRRLLSMVLAAVLLMMAAAGCESTVDAGSSGAESQDTAQSATADPPADDADAAVGGFHPEGYPIVDEPVTLTFVIRKNALAGDYNAMPVVKDYEAKTNIHIEWQGIPEEGFDEKKNLLFASNDLPDAFIGGGLTPYDEMTYGGQGMLIPLGDLIEQYAPNIKTMFEKRPAVKKSITTPDGNIYALPAVEEKYHQYVVDKMYINKTWLDQLSLPVPETTEEFYETLLAFKTQDPNGNGQADEIPLSLYKDDFKSLFGSFGTLDNVNSTDKSASSHHVVLAEDKASYAPISDEYKEGLKYLNRLYEAGLIDQEAFTQEYTQLDAKGKLPDQVLGSFIRIADFIVLGNEGTADYVTLPPLKGPDGTQLWNKDIYSQVRKGHFAITSVNDHPEATVRWIDYMFDFQGAMEFTDGPENVRWRWRDDGKYELMETPEGKNDAQWRAELCLAGYTAFFYSYEDEAKNVITLPIFENLFTSTAMYEPFFPQQVYPQVYFTNEQSDRLNVLTEGLDNYADQMKAQFITGSADIDAEWDNYIQTFNKMGLEEFLQIYQDAYNTYNAN